MRRFASPIAVRFEILLFEMLGLNHLKQAIANLGPGHPVTRAALQLAAIRAGSSLRFENKSIMLRQRGRTYVFAAKHFTYLPMMFSEAEAYFAPVLEDAPNRYDYSVPAWHTYAKSRRGFFFHRFLKISVLRTSPDTTCRRKVTLYGMRARMPELALTTCPTWLGLRGKCLPGNQTPRFITAC